MDSLGYWKDFMGLFFPVSCSLCQRCLVRSEQGLCTSCWLQLPHTGYHHDPSNNPLAERLYGRLPLMYAMGLYRFRRGGYVQQLVHAIKYTNEPGLAYTIGKLYGSQLITKKWLHPFDLIVPVPLHPKRLRQRGYNQSEYFARGLSDGLSIPYVTQLLRRLKYTESQTTKNKMGRLQQLGDAFSIDPAFVSRHHVLLVDDVITTGATIEACVSTLLQAGIPAISLAVMAVTE